MYIIWVKKVHLRKQTQFYGLLIQALEWQNSFICFSRHIFPHKPLCNLFGIGDCQLKSTYVFLKICNREDRLFIFISVVLYHFYLNAYLQRNKNSKPFHFTSRHSPCTAAILRELCFRQARLWLRPRTRVAWTPS